MRHRKRKGYTLVEAVVTLACMGIMLGGVFAVVSYLNFARKEALIGIKMNSYVINVAETLQDDLDRGDDITAIDYGNDSRLKTPSLITDIVVYYQDDIFGNTLYQVNVDMRDKQVDTRYIAHFLLYKDALRVRPAIASFDDLEGDDTP